jgi:virginiamycin A acetyltransferase
MTRPSPVWASVREMLAQLLRTRSAARRHPHVRFSHNVSVGPDCRFGRHVTVERNARLARADVGDYSFVGGSACLQNARIGKFCSIGPEVWLGLGVHPVDHVSTYPGFYSMMASGSVAFVTTTLIDEHPLVEVGHDVWIGLGARVMDGVRIDHGAIIAAGAIVTRDVAPYAIVGGVPARHLRNRFNDDLISFLLDFAWWNRDENFLRAHADLFQDPQVFRKAMSA